MKPAQATDTINPKGTLRLQCIDKEGAVIWDETINNLVVNFGRRAITRLLVGGFTGESLSQIAFGTSAAPTTVSDSAITGSFAKSFGTPTFPTVNSVSFPFTLETSEANGMTIYEFGLINANGTLFSRLVRAGGIAKTSAVRLVGTWTLNF